MTDVELVIRIPEHYYENNIKKDLPIYLSEDNIIKILPKGHGRLIDADSLPLHAIDDANYGSNYIRIAPTIIEADKAESEGKECR